MNPNQIAILVAFYFSKFDKEGMKNLGFRSDSEAFEKVANILGVKKNYVKFRRDEFDSIHPWRKGWQRPMDNRIVRAIEALQDLSEENLREIVKNILLDASYREGKELLRITSLFTEETKSKNTDAIYIPRGPTGRKAEEFFIQYHKRNSHPEKGELIDTRENGCGYDFEIRGFDNYYVEVKGLVNEYGGILFTNKEWETARKLNVKYILVIVSGIDVNPEIRFIYDPANKIHPKKSIVTTVQVQWNVSAKELFND